MTIQPTYQKVCASADLAPGTVVALTVEDIPIALVRTENDEYFAVHDECSHQLIALSEGDVYDCSLECTLHGSRFDLRTGEPTCRPATKPVPVFPVEVRDGDVYISLVPSNGIEP
jgi:3-phenylpropionate/trans-cinnamate dioxygenase ferredoxin subunit